MSLKDVEYAYAVAYIKTLENKMLSRADIESLINAPGIDSAMKLLNDRGFEGQTPQLLLKNALERSWEAAYEVCPEEAPIDILMYENDFHNLKTILKAKVSDTDWSGMVLKPSVIAPELISEAVKNSDFSLLPEFIRETAAGAYKLITTTMDGQLAEIYIDKAEHIAVYERAKKEKNAFLTDWAILLATLTNMKTAFRCAVSKKSKDFTKNALVPINGAMSDSLLKADSAEDVKQVILSQFDSADVSSIGAFERWCDNKKLSFVRTAKGQSFGFLPILAFLVGKSFEIQTLRIILSCKQSGVDEQIIRERLRDLYV